MKLVYLANVRLPTEKAHGVQIMKMCEAFASLGHQVTLVVPRRQNVIKTDPFEYYGVERTFSIRTVVSHDTVAFGRLGFWWQEFTFTIATILSGVLKTADLVCGRDELVLLHVQPFTKARLIWESHVGVWNFVVKALVRRVDRVVTISRGLADFYRGCGVASDRIIVAPDAIDESFLQPSVSRMEARQRLGLSESDRIAMYIGRVDHWKGVETFLEASTKLSDVKFVCIGTGEPEYAEPLMKRYPNVQFLGEKPYRGLVVNQRAADVLVIPNTAKNRTSAEFTSPLKLFAHMASGVPLVVSDLPSMREIVSDQEVWFMKPDDAASCAEMIQLAMEQGDEAKKRAERARDGVKKYTWRERAVKILKG